MAINFKAFRRSCGKVPCRDLRRPFAVIAHLAHGSTGTDDRPAAAKVPSRAYSSASGGQLGIPCDWLWSSTSFGTRGSQVQILPLRPALSRQSEPARQNLRQCLADQTQNIPWSHALSELSAF